MTVASTQSGPAELPEIGELIDLAIRLLLDERKIFFSGNYELLGSIVPQKTAVLADIESQIVRTRPNLSLVAAMKRLVQESRFNERIIAAAQQGVAHARRRLRAIEDMRAGAVAYAEDGTRITSKEDQVADGKIA